MRDEVKIRGQKVMPSQAWLFSIVKVPDQKELERAMREIKEPRITLREVGAYGLIRDGRVKFTGRGLRGRKLRRVDEVWIFAEKEELYRRFIEAHPELRNARFMDTTKAITTPRAKEGRISPKINYKLRAVPERAVILSDVNPVGRFLAESVANVLVANGVKDVKFAVATERARPVKYKPPDESGYSPEARKEIVRRIYDAGFTRVAMVLEDLLFKKLKLFPKREEARIFGARGRAGILTLVLIDDLSRRRLVTVDVNGEEMRFPTSSPVDPTRARVTIKPKSEPAFRAVSHDEAVTWLVSHGVAPEDAELILERLWLRGVISYPRNNGLRVHPDDVERVRDALRTLGRNVPERFEVSEDDVGLYIVDGKAAQELTGVEKQFVDWLADRLSTQTINAEVSVEFYTGKSDEPVDTYYSDNEVIEASGGLVDGVFPVVDVDRAEGGVPASVLVREMQRLGIGTEATRGRILQKLREAGLITGGEKISITHNGRVVATTVRLVFKNAGDVDAIKRIMAKLERAAVENRDVDRALIEAWRETFRKRDEFLHELYRSLLPAEKRVKMSIEEVIAVGLYVHGDPMSWREIRRLVIGERRWKRIGFEAIRRAVAESPYFELVQMERRNGRIVEGVKLTEEGREFARSIIVRRDVDAG